MRRSQLRIVAGLAVAAVASTLTFGSIATPAAGDSIDDKQAAAQKEKAASGGNPFGSPAGEEIDYEKAAAALDLPQDFSKFLK